MPSLQQGNGTSASAGLPAVRPGLKLESPSFEVADPNAEINKLKVGGFMGDLPGGKKHNANVDLPDTSLDVRSPKADVQLAAPNVDIRAQVAVPKMVQNHTNFYAITLLLMLFHLFAYYLEASA